MQRDGFELIAIERTRQLIVEGYSPEHDDTHDRGELLDAGICYAFAAIKCENRHKDTWNPPSQWPWSDESWNPSDDYVRNLEKAGALIAAEIDRHHRQQSADA